MPQLRTASQVEAQYQLIQGALSGRNFVINPAELPTKAERVAEVEKILSQLPDDALVEIVTGVEPQDWTQGAVFDKKWVLDNPGYYGDTPVPWTLFVLTPAECVAFAPNTRHEHQPIGELFIISCGQVSMDRELLAQVNKVLRVKGDVPDFAKLAMSDSFDDFMEIYPCIDVATHHTHFQEPNNQSPRGFRAQDCSAYYLKPGYTFEDFLRMVSEFALWPVRKGNATA